MASIKEAANLSANQRAAEAGAEVCQAEYFRRCMGIALPADKTIFQRRNTVARRTDKYAIMQDGSMRRADRMEAVA